ncbi:hypothetical protein BC829DRAFT_388057 [Chytridium lagenaria]|nr:hypothetical protein BC829DRAFT_388057 [Chytridium lagenaria]
MLNSFINLGTSFTTPFKSGVKTRYEAFTDHCDHVKAYYSRRKVAGELFHARKSRSGNSFRPNPQVPHISQTNLPHHLSLIARYLKEEDDEIEPGSDAEDEEGRAGLDLRRKRREGSIGKGNKALELSPCLELLFQSGFLRFLVDAAEKDDPPGMHQQTLDTFSLIIRNLSQSRALLAETTFGRALSRLLVSKERKLKFWGSKSSSTSFIHRGVTPAQEGIGKEPGLFLKKTSTSSLLSISSEEAAGALQDALTEPKISKWEDKETYVDFPTDQIIGKLLLEMIADDGLEESSDDDDVEDERKERNDDQLALGMAAWWMGSGEYAATSNERPESRRPSFALPNQKSDATIVTSPPSRSASMLALLPTEPTSPVISSAHLEIGRAAGSLSNSILRILTKSPRLTRMFLESVTPPSLFIPSVDANIKSTDGTLPRWSHASDDTERESFEQSEVTVVKKRTVPERFRPLETAMELMGHSGALGRIGRETVIVAVELLAAISKECLKESSVNALNSLDEVELPVLYGDYLSYIVHHSQLPSLLAQELAIRFSEIPGLRLQVRSLSKSSNIAENTEYAEKSRASLKHALGSFLRFWAFIDAILEVAFKKSTNVEKAVMERTISGTLKTCLVREMATVDGALEGIISHFDPSLFKAEPMFSAKLLDLVEGLLSGGNMIATRLLGTWYSPDTIDMTTDAYAANRSVVRDTFVSLLSALGPLVPEEAESPLDDLDSYILAALEHKRQRDGQKAAVKQSTQSLETRREGLIVQKLPFLISLFAEDNGRERMAIRIALLLETMGYLCSLDGVVKTGHLLIKALEKTRHYFPSQDSVASITEAQNLSKASTIRQNSLSSTSDSGSSTQFPPLIERVASITRLDRIRTAQPALQWIMKGLDDKRRESPTSSSGKVSTDPDTGSVASWFAGGAWTASASTLFGVDGTSFSSEFINPNPEKEQTYEKLRKGSVNPSVGLSALQAATKSLAGSIMVRFGRFADMPSPQAGYDEEDYIWN